MIKESKKKKNTKSEARKLLWKVGACVFEREREREGERQRARESERERKRTKGRETGEGNDWMNGKERAFFIDRWTKSEMGEREKERKKGMRDFLRINETNQQDKVNRVKHKQPKTKQWNKRKGKQASKQANNGKRKFKKKQKKGAQKFHGIAGDSLFDFLIFRRFSRGTTGASPPRSHPAPVTTAEQDKQDKSHHLPPPR